MKNKLIPICYLTQSIQHGSLMKDVTGHSLIKSSKIKIDETFKTYGLIDSENLKTIFNSSELIPYIHNVCFVFQENGIKNWKQAKNVLDKFLKSWIPEDDSFIFKYIEQCKSLKQFSWFEQRPLTIYMIMLCSIYHQHINTIKNYVAGYFNQKVIQINQDFGIELD